MTAPAYNFVKPADIITLTWATTSPTMGQPVVKSKAKATGGGLVGVALNGTGVASESVEVALEGMFNLEIVAGSAMKIGDTVFTSLTTGEEVCTSVLSDTNTGIPFGHLCEAITDASTVTRKVRLCQHTYLGA